MSLYELEQVEQVKQLQQKEDFHFIYLFSSPQLMAEEKYKIGQCKNLKENLSSLTRPNLHGEYIQFYEISNSISDRDVHRTLVKNGIRRIVNGF